MNMFFIKNLWYVAAYSEDITRTLISRTICNEPILMYRRENGVAVAMGNRCPHRFAPLDMGRLDGDNVECGYHGLVFGPNGQCVSNPHGAGRLPAACRVPSYPLREKYGLIWLWFGDAGQLDERLIPDFSCLIDTARFATVKGVISMAANYELITDNLLDLSHVEFVHKGILGSEAIRTGKHTVTQEGLTVRSNRWCPDGIAPPAWDAMFGNYGRPVDHWLNMRWDPPAHMLLDVGITYPGKDRSEGIWTNNINIITPETATTSHYFWSVSRAYEVDSPAVDDLWRQAIKGAFNEQDKPMLEAVQRMMGSASFTSLKPVMIEPDTGAVRCRRVIAKLLAGEEQLEATG